MIHKTVLVTGIGGNVGQGILRNIQRLELGVRLVGTNTDKVSSGNHLCDAVHELPYAFEPGYIDRIIAVCDAEHVDLVIPATDWETYFLALNVDRLPTVAASPPDTAAIFLDKFLTYNHFFTHGIAFARSALPHQYKGNFRETIVKPRKGRGSRGIHVNPPNPSAFDANEFVVQELYRGSEITTAFYVTRTGALLGHITFERSLSAGTTSSCVVTRTYDEALESTIKALMTSLAIRGSCNIQSIATNDGAIVPFEINGRISGTNSIRSHFGFEDVRYTLEEYLLDQTPNPPVITPGAGVRILMDVIYPGLRSLDQIHDRSTNHYLS